MTEPVPQVDHIQTSTRDLDDTRARMERWLQDHVGHGARVTALATPSSTGMSSETLLFDASWDGATRSLVARVAPDPANTPVFPVYDLALQYRIIGSLGELGTVPVPPVFWCEPDPAPLGAPFFVMGRIDGDVPPDVMPYNFGSWVTEATADQQLRLQESAVAVLAAIHAVDDPRARFGFAGTEGSALRAHVEAQRRYYEWVAEGVPSPLIDACFAWLEQHWPDEESDPVLSWGDARIGNMIFRDFEPVAVLDWEMAAIAPPEVDVAWFIVLHRFFEDIAAKYGLGGMPHFLRRDDVIASYERESGRAVRDIEFFTMYAAMRHGVIMSRTQRRAIHFGEAEMPDDVDDLILHRAMLEEMLAGTYWDRVLG